MKKFLSSVFVALTLTGSSYVLTDSQAFANQFDAGYFQKNVQYWQKVVREHPNDILKHYLLGQAYARTGQIDKAIESFKKESEYFHDYMITYAWLGKEYEEKGDYSDALFYASKSLELEKRFERIFKRVDVERRDLITMALVYRDEGNYSKSFEYDKKVLELENGKPKRGTIYNNIALVYFDMHNYKKAIEYFKKAIDVDEENGDYLDARGWSGDIGKAMYIYEEKVHYLNSGKWMINLGNTYRKAKDFKDAKLYLEKGLERVKKVGNKDWEGIGYEYFGLYYRDTGNKALAKEYFTKAYNIFKAVGDDGHASAVMRYLSSIK